MAYGITLITELYDRLTPELPGIATPEMRLSIIDVMRDFCTKTECWQEQITQTLTASTVAYTLTAAATDADIRRIKWVKIRSASTDELDAITETDPQYYAFNGNVTLTLSYVIKPTSTVTSGLVTKVILAPKLNAATWDTALMNRYSDAIVAGVKARLMDNDRERWGNPRRAASYLAEYNNSVAGAKCEYLREFRTGSIMSTPRSWL
jgi:hypothetical protein